MAGSASELRNVLVCPLCGRTLFPVPVDSTVTFHCKSGHELALGDLLRAQSSAVKGGLELLLSEWDRQLQAMISTVEDARKNGYLDVAEIFNRHARSLESRISKVRDAFLKTDSSRLIKLPDDIHSV